jgi:tetratricopeptide (TPR) repeat protein
MTAFPATAFLGHTGDDIHREIKKGVENYDKGRYEDAIESFNKIIKMTEAPSSKEDWNFRGTAFHYLNDYYEAIRCFDEASLDLPDYLEPLLNKALSLRRLGKYYESMQALNKYLSRKPKAYRVINVKGVVYDDLKSTKRRLNVLTM